MIRVSIGVFAYNEERTIAQTLNALLLQKCKLAEILEILVVSSASADGTDASVEEVAAVHPRLRLIREQERRGKASAINRYLAERHPHAEVCILASADLLPDLESVEKLTIPFADPCIGMAGGRPMPVNDRGHFLGYVVHLQWRLHHLISLSQPKCGEMVAIRSDLTDRIPEESPVDEASLEAIAIARGFHLCYAPKATFKNRGPETVREFVAQRRRIASGHQWLKRTSGYRVATGSPWTILRALAGQLRLRPLEWIWILGAIGLEAYCRLLGALDLLLRPNAHQAWEVVPSTKQAFNSGIRDRVLGVGCQIPSGGLRGHKPD